MKEVGKYNTFKGISTLLTIGTPIITLACCGDFFVERPATAISAAGVFAILIALLFAKDKLAEKLKSPSAFIVSAAVLVIIVVVENILLPMKYVCIATMIASGVDELEALRQQIKTQAEAQKQLVEHAVNKAQSIVKVEDKPAEEQVVTRY